MTVATAGSGRDLSRWATFREATAQPRIWRGWAGRLAGHSDEIRAWLAHRAPEEIWFCGAGTSAFIGEALAAALSAPDAPIRYRAIATTDLVGRPERFFPAAGRILVVSFGRSGDSSETIGTLDLLDRFLPQADRLHFTCNPEGALATRPMTGTGELRVVLLPPETNDTGFAMTSSYSMMLLSALACLDPSPPLPLAVALDRLADDAEALIGSALAAAGAGVPSRAVFLGAGVLAASARECALKVLELAKGNIPTLWDTPLGFRHGPKAFIDENTRVYVLVSGDPAVSRYDLDAADELRRQFGPRAVVTLGSGDADIAVPVVGNDAWSGVLHVLVAQMLAISWSDALDINVDNPFVEGNLSRVVSGVTLYTYQPKTAALRS